MGKELKLPLWNGKRIAKDDDVDDLERRSALYEFKHRMNRHDAEHRAHHEYKKDKHREAAAYHLAGLKAAQASGSHEDAHKHGMMYQLHLKELGLDPEGPVPADVSSQMKKLDRFYKFKPHHGDGFLLQDEGSPTPMDKSEPLTKGNVVQFPKDRVTKPSTQAKPATVSPIGPAQHVARQQKMDQAKGTIDQLFNTMAQDPGMQELARQRAVQAKAQQLKMGGQKFKRGDRVVCSHHDHPEDPGGCSYPWVGTVSGYEPNMSRDAGNHTYTVEWEHTPGQTGQGIHGQEEIDHLDPRMGKSEEPLEKGQVIPFPSHKVTPAVDQGKPANVAARIGPESATRSSPAGSGKVPVETPRKPPFTQGGSTALRGPDLIPPQTPGGAALINDARAKRAQQIVQPASRKSPVAGKRVGKPVAQTPKQTPNEVPPGWDESRKNAPVNVDTFDYLDSEHHGRALDDEDDYNAVLHGLARRYGVHPDVIDQELYRHSGRALDDAGDLNEVVQGMNRHLTNHFNHQKQKKSEVAEVSKYDGPAPA